MDQLSIVGDLFTTLAVVGLIALFTVALGHAYHVYAERRAAHEDFELTLSIAERLKSNVLVKHDNNVYPGLINPETFEERLPEYSGLLAKQGIEMRIEVRLLSGELILEYGPSRNPLSGYLSPPCSVSLPVAIGRTSSTSRRLGELTVQVWRS